MVVMMKTLGYRVAAPACVGVANLAVGRDGVRVGALRKHVLERSAVKIVKDGEQRTWESIVVMVGDGLRP